MIKSIKLENDEKVIVHGILLDHTLNTVNLLNEQRTEEDAQKVYAVVVAMGSCLCEFFARSLDDEISLEDSKWEAIYEILNNSLENLKDIKNEAIKIGHNMGFELSSKVEVLHNICMKIPRKSLIITE